MVVHDPLDFDLLLGRDYVYAMKSIVSTLFRVISFPHDGRVVTIDQLSFVGPNLTINSMTSLNGSYMQSISPLPQVNYVALSPMPSTADDDDLDLVVDMVISSMGLLEPDLLTPVATFDMFSFQRTVLLEAMIKKRIFEHGFLISSSLKNETSFEHGFLISSSLKNETNFGHDFLISSSLKNEANYEDSFLSMWKPH
jgi:hypothetical protein